MLLYLIIFIVIENCFLQIIPSGLQKNTYTDLSQHWPQLGTVKSSDLFLSRPQIYVVTTKWGITARYNLIWTFTRLSFYVHNLFCHDICFDIKLIQLQHDSDYYGKSLKTCLFIALCMTQTTDRFAVILKNPHCPI